ncbi:hypothetical protein B2J93_4357 [Marssonina coronariae]|uniref:Uncharacterized protein n=1 Tax=Diplocarpon coronariae TaxID=2795749 RepID=A0A218ZGE5_9HELO|nr:hypothetical protein B2J93_4357 [Marssonina coronariae]
MSPAASEAPGRPPTAAPSTVSRVTAKAKEYTKFWAAHVKKGEVPWTQWYCCGLVNGKIAPSATSTLSPSPARAAMVNGDRNASTRITGYTRLARSAATGSATTA